MSEHDGDRPAFPMFNMNPLPGTAGMSIREHAAITLRVPDSGQPWLDDMIGDARRWDAAQAIAAGLIVGCAGYLGREADGSPHFSAYASGPCNSVIANRATVLADALLSALKPAEWRTPDQTPVDGQRCEIVRAQVHGGGSFFGTWGDIGYSIYGSGGHFAVDGGGQLGLPIDVEKWRPLAARSGTEG